MNAEANKKAALAYFQALMGDKDYEAARAYAAEYIQHDPMAGDGFDALVAMLQNTPFFRDAPRHTVQAHHVVAEGDLVYFQIHREMTSPDGTLSRMNTVHCFRFNEAGKIAEHWTIRQSAAVADSVNPHPLF